MHQSSFHSRSRIILGILPALAILFIHSLSQGVFAQTAESDWSEPYNLSQSGGSSQPRLAVDSEGRLNVLWIDDFAGLVAMQSVDGKWTDPVSISVPFSGDATHLEMVAGVNGVIHVAWSNSEGSLYYSQVRGENFTNSRLWGFVQRIGSSAADFDLAVSATGDAQLTYLRSEQSLQLPAGVYTIPIRVGGGLATTRLLYASPYFRGLKAGEAQVSLAVGSDKEVYIAWDEPIKGQVWLATSEDGGESWSEPQSVDRRQAEDGAGESPSRPILSVTDQQVLLVWQAGHQGQTCAHYSQFSPDAGQSWEPMQLLPNPLGESCAQNLQITQNAEAGAWLLASMPTGVQLLNWQADPETGGRWGEPSLQSALSGFIDPDTYRQVTLGCLDANLAGTRLLVVGCEQQINQDEQKGDIWLLERSLNQPASAAQTPIATLVWSTPAALESSEQALNEPLLVADQNGHLHALWTRQEDAGLYYAGWDGKLWSQALVVLESPGDTPQGLTAAMLPDGMLFVAWSDAADGNLYYSLAPAAQAGDPATWLATQELPAMDGATAPQALARQDGKVAVVYAVPFNEARGIYLVESQAPPQVGQLVQWSAPVMVFDAVAAGWESLSQPHMVEDDNGSLHLLWTRYRLPPNAQPDGLYATRSSGDGWLGIEEVEAGQVLWSQIMAAPDGKLHRAWVENLNGRATFFHQYSLDNGQSWSKAERLSEVQTSAAISLVVDESGQLILLQVAENPSLGAGAAPELQQWVWQAGAWRQDESQGMSGVLSASALSAAAPQGSLAALFSGVQEATPTPGGTPQPAVQATAEPAYAMFYSARQRGTGQQTAIETGQAAFTPVATALVNAEFSPTPMPTFSSQPPKGLGRFLGERGSVIMIGIIPGIFLIALGFYIATREINKRM